MNWKLFIARRIYRDNKGGKEVSKPAIRIAMVGIAIGLAVMIVSVAVSVGFKHQVRDKVVGMGADIVVSNIEGSQLYQMAPVMAGDSLRLSLQLLPGVSRVQRYSTKMGMVKTAEGMTERSVPPFFPAVPPSAPEIIASRAFLPWNMAACARS